MVRFSKQQMLMFNQCCSPGDQCGAVASNSLQIYMIYVLNLYLKQYLLTFRYLADIQRDVHFCLIILYIRALAAQLKGPKETTWWPWELNLVPSEQ